MHTSVCTKYNIIIIQPLHSVDPPHRLWSIAVSPSLRLYLSTRLFIVLSPSRRTTHPRRSVIIRIIRTHTNNKAVATITLCPPTQHYPPSRPTRQSMTVLGNVRGRLMMAVAQGAERDGGGGGGVIML